MKEDGKDSKLKKIQRIRDLLISEDKELNKLGEKLFDREFNPQFGMWKLRGATNMTNYLTYEAYKLGLLHGRESITNDS